MMDIASISALDEKITAQAWEQTPASVRLLLRHLCEDLLERVAALEEGEVLRLIERKSSERMAAGAGGSGDTPKRRLRCSFCGGDEREGVKMVSGQHALICTECVEVCNAVLADE